MAIVYGAHWLPLVEIKRGQARGRLPVNEPQRIPLATSNTEAHMSNPHQEDLPKHVVMTIDEDGTAKAYAISLLEDLWHDVLYFEYQALNTSTEVRPLLHQRFLRAGLLCLFAYLEGVTHQWCYTLTIREGGSETQARKRSRVDLAKRCKDLTKVAAALDPTVYKLDVQRAKFLRNKIVHESGGDHDLELFGDLTIETFQTTKSDMVRWLERVGATTGLKPHLDTDQSLDWFAEVGTTTHAEHSGDGLS